MAKELDGTFVADFTKRELFMTLYAALQAFNDGKAYLDLQNTYKLEEHELENLHQHLTEFFEQEL